MRLALAQLDPTVGDVARNARAILDAVDRAAEAGADVLLTGELAVLGYPPRDLLLRDGVVDACAAAVERIVEHGRTAPHLTVIVGHPRRAAGVRPIRNSATVSRGGAVLAVHDKRLLPGYDVFDEDRWFAPGEATTVVEIAGRRVGVLICEDLWRAGDVSAALRYAVDPVADAVAAGAEVLVALNASPFVAGKWNRHVEQLREVARDHGRPIVAVNQVGGNDDLVFDGRSVVVGADGAVRACLPGWEPALAVVDLDAPGGDEPAPADRVEEIFDALVLGVRDYAAKTGHDRALLGLSGGIDSAVVAVLAAQALGPANVTAVMLPSRYTAPMSRADASEIAGRLGLAFPPPVSIEAAHQAVSSALQPALGAQVAGVVDENLQARLRGLMLMALSNAGHGLLLSTSNKSELAVGYSTLYGDMCGALAVIGDLVKADVYALARWMNAEHERLGLDRPPIPDRVLDRPPSAELRANQTDQDTLPPYDELDAIVRAVVEEERSIAGAAAATGLDEALVADVVRMIDRAEFKRHQATIVLKVSPRAFGRGREYPLVMRSADRTGTPVEGTRRG